MRHPLVSGYIIACNEERWIGQAVLDLLRYTDDVVVVDSSPGWGTAEAAVALGARVVRVPMADSFAEQRNRALALLRRPWALYLDADETFSRGLARVLSRLLEAPPEVQGWAFMRYFTLPDRRYLTSPDDHWQVRLVRSQVRYRNTCAGIHETPALPEGRLRRCREVACWHHQLLKSPQELRRKAAPILARDGGSDPQRLSEEWWVERRTRLLAEARQPGRAAPVADWDR